MLKNDSMIRCYTVARSIDIIKGKLRESAFRIECAILTNVKIL